MNEWTHLQSNSVQLSHMQHKLFVDVNIAYNV